MKKSENVIVNGTTLIEVSRLKIHPQNVRKQYRNLEELVESVKARGILQNLTVVPDPEDEGTYFVVIGNRRLMAAKQAGIESVPCIISDMGEKEQVQTMLLENMQRDDLTVYEQSCGFQMCLDLGMTEKELSEKTGLSKQTIKHRTKIQLLDQKLVEQKSDEGATIFDFIKLEQVKDIDRRNKLMTYIGTNNFNIELERAINDEKAEKRKEEIVKILRGFAEEINEVDWTKMEYKDVYYTTSDRLPQVPEDSQERKYFYRINYGYIYLYQEKIVTEEQTKQNEEYSRQKEERDRIAKEFRELGKTFYNLRQNYITDKSRKSTSAEVLMKYAILLISSADLQFRSDDDDLYGICFDDDIYGEIVSSGLDGLYVEDIMEDAEKNPVKTLENLIYCTLEVGSDIECVTYEGCYEYDTHFKTLYDFMQSIGYVMSDEEQQILNGTHKLYVTSDSESAE